MTPPGAAAGPLGRTAAWLGAGAFVASLGYFVVAYGIRFGRTTLPPPEGPGDLAGPLLANAALFTAFAVHHSLLARTAIKRWLTARVPRHLERTLYVWVASVLFGVTLAWWQEVPGVAWRLEAPWHLPGHAVQVLGVWLTLRSARAVDIWDLAGIRQASGHAPRVELARGGPYRWVRHPIYLGWVCLVFGVPHMTGTRLAFACISTAYLALAVPIEERTLVQTFGDEYRAYQRRVRWRMLPFVY